MCVKKIIFSLGMLSLVVGMSSAMAAQSLPAVKESKTSQFEGTNNRAAIGDTTSPRTVEDNNRAAAVGTPANSSSRTGEAELSNSGSDSPSKQVDATDNAAPALEFEAK